MGNMVDEDLAKLVKRIVREKRLRLRDIERLSGGKISNGYISDLMAGKQSNPTIEKIHALAQGLGVHPGILFEAASSQYRDRERLEIEIPQARAFVDMLRRIIDSPRILGILEALVYMPEHEQDLVLRFVREYESESRQVRQRTSGLS